ncbi:MAG: 3'-phosphoesterase [Theionarchaea archaeon]|nr:3'-phosphoesterase [Theionarchaea archaeon]MBU7001303.1 3'-phosphoesterase [Theionarchaea archaeon]MBU7019794.1 3'-phosphoesterase [Theionarchaea archaeon]MBU7035576.1 3'-phosphoesterase [Theionarchaea archaeon]MBU7041220.1 3'-phosphoesterase [Theionarchaea archaeon]
MSLEEYEEKRNFEKTPEPQGTRGGKGRMYVIQKHNASHLHYDLRLEKDGVLKSWALPKEPPLTPGVRRLAVQTEDHPVAYAAFQGVIPKGEYGAGTVEIWDSGTYSKEKWEEREIIVDLDGEKLRGLYCLIAFKSNKNWLFFKKK